jgi:predicted nucleic acid binding AN1-type Zn finger protein
LVDFPYLLWACKVQIQQPYIQIKFRPLIIISSVTIQKIQILKKQKLEKSSDKP